MVPTNKLGMRLVGGDGVLLKAGGGQRVQPGKLGVLLVKEDHVENNVVFFFTQR